MQKSFSKQFYIATESENTKADLIKSLKTFKYWQKIEAAKSENPESVNLIASTILSKVYSYKL